MQLAAIAVAARPDFFCDASDRHQRSLVFLLRHVSARPLAAADILVVTPYNAQVARLREALEAAGLGAVRVGTVDKFQGQEGAVVLISMAASARSDVSRGVGFLLDRHRLNVALSRGKWAAYLVCSPELTDFAPQTPGELLLLGSFLRLTEPAAPSVVRPAPTRNEQLALF